MDEKMVLFSTCLAVTEAAWTRLEVSEGKDDAVRGEVGFWRFMEEVTLLASPHLTFALALVLKQRLCPTKSTVKLKSQPYE